MTRRRLRFLSSLALLGALACQDDPGAGASPASTGSAPTGEALAALLDDLPPSRSAHLEASLPGRGDALPVLAGTTLDGDLVDNDAFKGKVTLLNLWFYG